MLRVVIAGLVGGVLIFCMGAFNHMVLQLGERTMQDVPNEAAMRNFVHEQNLDHGIYTFPPHKHATTEADMEKLNEAFKAGPNGMLIIGRNGEEMMPPSTLIMEFLTNVTFALLAAGIVSRLDPNYGFCTRWLTVVVMGAAGWLSLTVSYGIWYRFHAHFIRDELFGSLIECAVAGLAIAAIAKPCCGGCVSAAKPS